MKFIVDETVPDDVMYIYNKDDFIIWNINCTEKTKEGYKVTTKPYVWIKKHGNK